MINEAEVTTPVAEETQQATQTAQVEQSATPVQESKAQLNLRVMRERMEAAEREKAEMANRMKQWEENLKRQQYSQQSYENAPQQAQEDFNFDIEDDALVEGKHVKKYLKSIAQEVRQTKKELQEARQLTQATAAESYAASRFADFKQIVNEDNLRNLQTLHPEDFNSIMANPDPKARFVTAYNMIKNYGISDSEYESINKKLEANKGKPKPAAAAGAQIPDTPLSRIGDYDRRILSKEDKKMIMNRLNEYKKRS